MSISLIDPVELPLTLGQWFWEHREAFDQAVVVESRDDYAVLRLDVDPPMDDEPAADPYDGYVYVEIGGDALFAETAQRLGVFAVPAAADFRGGLRAARMEAQQRAERIDVELESLRRFKRQTVSAITFVAVAAACIIILRMLA
jgi:hypothetical protein